jgi:hypothetical protein
MTIIQIDAGTLEASETDRTVTGLLVPYGEECASNLGKFSVDPGVLKVPADLSGMSLNVEHKREHVIGQPTAMRETEKGIVATFSIARTPEGDQALADIKAGSRRSLSVEAADMILQAGRAISGRIFAASLVAKPAFPSATLLASAPDTLTADEVAATIDEATYVDENGVTWRRVEESTTELEIEEDGTTTTTTTTVVEEAPQDENTSPDTTEETATVVTANTLAAKLATTETITTQERPTLLAAQVFQLVAEAKNGNQDAMGTLMAALTDVKITGTGAAAGAGVLRDDWVGQMWTGRAYERKFINLGRLGTAISAAGKSGFKAARGTAASPLAKLGGTWAGNKAEVSSGTISTSKHTSTLLKWAFGADIAREFFDLPGGSEVIEAMVRLIIEDYAVWSDESALLGIITAAGTAVAPKAPPAGYSASMAMLIQGILNVRRAKDTPTFALVNETAYEQLLLTPKDLIPEFVSFAFNTEGTGAADAGRVVVVEAPQAAFTGLVANTPAVLVGAQNGIEFDELGSTPIVIDAVEIAKGGIDRGVYGYLQTFQVRPESFSLVATVTP